MNKLKSLLAAAVTAFACVVTADTAPTSFWWHFNGADGEAAPTTLSDTTGNYTLTLQQYGSGTLTTQESQSESQGRIAYWQTGEGLAVDEDVAGAVQMYRFDANGKYKASRYMLDDAQTRAVLPVNAAGDIKSFTLEMVYKCDPWDGSLCPNAHNMTFAALTRKYGGKSGTIMNVDGLNGGALYLQCTSYQGSNYDVINGQFIADAATYRDGRWHHLAVVYTLDESVTPCQGKAEVYLDYVRQGSANCKEIAATGHKGFVYEASDEPGAVTTAELAIGEINSNYASGMIIDEVRLTQAALSKDEFFHLQGEQVSAFHFPLGVKGELTKNLDGTTLLTADAVAQQDLFPARRLTSGGDSVVCQAAADLTGAGSLSVSAIETLLLANGPFTLETTFRTESAAAQTLWSKGTEWSVTLSDGALVWNHGAASETVATGLADGDWHSVALVYEPDDSTATITFAVDGAMKAACADTVPLAKMSPVALTVGAGFVGQLLGLRYTPRALETTGLLSLEPLADDGKSFWWHFNGADGREAPTTLSDRSGTFDLTRRQAAGVEPMSVQMTQTDGWAPASMIYWPWNGKTEFDADVKGSIRMYRRTDGGAGRCYAANYLLNDSALTKKLFPANDAHELKPFTLEMVFKVAPYDESLHGTAKNLFLASLLRTASNVSGAILNLCAISSGDLFLQCQSKNTNADLINWSILKAEKYRDGQWHHLALVYDLDETATPHCGSVTVYFDYGNGSTCPCSQVEGVSGPVRSFRYVQSSGTEESSAYLMLGDLNSAYGGETSIDEVRVTQKALTKDELFRKANVRRPFELRLNNPGHETEDAEGNVVATALNVKSRVVVPAVDLCADGRKTRCDSAAVFASGSALTVGTADACFLTQGAFTLESVFCTTAQDDQTLWSQGEAWSVSIEDGALVWKHGAASETVATGVADGAWHAVGLVVAPPTKTIYVDGVAHVLSDPTALPMANAEPLAIGSPFAGSLLGVRFATSALDAGSLQGVETVAAGEMLAYWPMTTSAAEGTTVDKAQESLGRTALAMSAYKTKTSIGDEHKPTWSHETPGRCVWIPATGKVLNMDNRTSVAFHNNATYDEAKQKWVNNGAGGYLLTDGKTANFGDAYTLEMFIRPSRSYEQFMTVIYKNGYDDNRYVLLDASCDTNPAIKYFTPGHASDPNKHQFFGGSGLTPGEWHHLALTVSQDSENVTLTGVLDYDKSATVTVPGPYSLTTGAMVQLGSGGGQEFDGLIDEVRVTRGVLPSASFMRVFELRTDLTGVWLMDGATGVEHFNNGALAYLDGTLAVGATASDDLPIADPVFRVKGKGIVHPTSSVAFDGTGGLVLPCQAVAGADDFTVEATVRGVGTVAAKKRSDGVSWSFGIGADGKPTMRIGETEVTAAAALDASAWHHLALVCDRSAGVATLYADSTAVAEAAVAELTLDDGDFVWGGDFAGQMIAARFAPEALTTDKFLVVGERAGTVLIFR